MTLASWCSRSRCTSGSAFSVTNTAAVVCATFTTHIPSRTFDRVTAARTREVTSTVVSRFSVLRDSFSWWTLTTGSSVRTQGGARRDDTSAMPTWGEARAAATTRLRSAPDPGTAALDARSEERRVGKECRSGGAADHYKTKSR